MQVSAKQGPKISGRGRCNTNPPSAATATPPLVTHSQQRGAATAAAAPPTSILKPTQISSFYCARIRALFSDRAATAAEGQQRQQQQQQPEQQQQQLRPQHSQGFEETPPS
ncbi:hypothetical protein Emed_007158 [Eimeria media]